MVEDTSTRADANRAVENWFDSLPGGTATLRRTDIESESVIRIEPRSSGASSVEFRISDYGTFGLYLGTAMAFEELPLTPQYLVEICQAVAAGQISETVLKVGRLVVRAYGVLRLASGDLHDTSYKSLLGTLGIGTRHHREYGPYVGSYSSPIHAPSHDVGI